MRKKVFVRCVACVCLSGESVRLRVRVRGRGLMCERGSFGGFMMVLRREDESD